MNLMTRPLARGTVRGEGLNIKLESPLAVPKGHARDLQRPLRLPPAASAAASCTPQRAPGGGACSAQRRVGTCKASASLAASLVGPGDTWAVWSLLLACGSFGLWAERTKWGAALSGPLVSTLAALALSNLGVLPPSAPAYSIVTGYLLPLAVPLLLFAADLRRVVRETGRLLGAFALGAAGTILGTAVAGFALRGPLAALGEDAWKMAAALCARHIGGAVNFVAVGEYLSASPSLMAAGLAADNVVCALYFPTLFALAGSVAARTFVGGAPPADVPPADEQVAEGDRRGAISVTGASYSLAASALICAASVTAARRLGLAGADIPIITAAVVALATLFPKQVGAALRAPISRALPSRQHQGRPPSRWALSLLRRRAWPRFCSKSSSRWWEQPVRCGSCCPPRRRCSFSACCRCLAIWFLSYLRAAPAGSTCRSCCWQAMRMSEAPPQQR